MFDHRQLEQLLDPPMARRTTANAELVVAYMRHGGCQETCLRVLMGLPRLQHRAKYILSCCGPPFTDAKLTCIREYARLDGAPRAMYEDLAYALRFSPDMAETILDMLARMAPADSADILPSVLRCLYAPYKPEVRMAAAQALVVLCTDPQWLGPHVMALVWLVPHGPSAVRVLSRMPDRAAPAIVHLVARAPACNASVTLLRAIADHHPRQLVEQGGVTALLRAGLPAPQAVLALFSGDPAAPTNVHAALAYMHCTMTLPPDVDRFMCAAMKHSCPDTRALFAVTYDMARDTADNVKPGPPCLPDYDVAQTGTVRLVPADNAEPTVALLAPLARAASFIAAHSRQADGKPVEVPVNADALPSVLKALLYDDIPCTDTLLLVSMAELANMWCAPRLLYLTVDALITCMGFYQLHAIAGEWPAVHQLLRYHAIEFLPCLARHENVCDLQTLLWPNAPVSDASSGDESV